MIRWIAAALIIAGCGGFGFAMAAEHKKASACLKQIQQVLNFMECQLQYRMSPLPELCTQAGTMVSGVVGQVFTNLGRELSCSVYPDVSDSVEIVLGNHKNLPDCARACLMQLGQSLGRFDLDGQLMGIRAVRESCSQELERLTENQDIRIRSYQTLGICAGAAVAIVLI